jgi:hypothetical protein
MFNHEFDQIITHLKKARVSNVASPKRDNIFRVQAKLKR